MTKDNVTYTLYFYDDKLDDIYEYGREFTDIYYNTAFVLIVENHSDDVIYLDEMEDAALIDFYGQQHQLTNEIELPPITQQRITGKIEKQYSFEHEKINKTWYEKVEGVNTPNEALANEIKEIKDEIRKSREEEMAIRKRVILNQYKETLLEEVKFGSTSIFPGGLKKGLLIFRAAQPNSLTRFRVNFMSHQRKPLAFVFQLIIEN